MRQRFMTRMHVCQAASDTPESTFALSARLHEPFGWPRICPGPFTTPNISANAILCCGISLDLMWEGVIIDDFSDIRP